MERTHKPLCRNLIAWDASAIQTRFQETHILLMHSKPNTHYVVVQKLENVPFLNFPLIRSTKTIKCKNTRLHVLDHPSSICLICPAFYFPQSVYSYPNFNHCGSLSVTSVDLENLIFFGPGNPHFVITSMVWHLHLVVGIA